MDKWLKCLDGAGCFPGIGCLLAGLGIAAFPVAPLLVLVYLALMLFGALFALFVSFTDLGRRTGDPVVSALNIAMTCMGVGMYVGISARLWTT